jgi:prepilin-type N-terminal cleavage/methylation domain-containing protein
MFTATTIGAIGSRPRDVRSRFAFTMVELVIVVMIISIVTAVAAPTFFESLLYHRVESAAHRLKADIELARHTARLKSAVQLPVQTRAVPESRNSIRRMAFTLSTLAVRRSSSIASLPTSAARMLCRSMALANRPTVERWCSLCKATNAL